MRSFAPVPTRCDCVREFIFHLIPKINFKIYHTSMWLPFSIDIFDFRVGILRYLHWTESARIKHTDTATDIQIRNQIYIQNTST